MKFPKLGCWPLQPWLACISPTFAAFMKTTCWCELEGDSAPMISRISRVTFPALIPDSPPSQRSLPLRSPACRTGQNRRPTMTEIQPSDAQAVFLSAACARDDQPQGLVLSAIDEKRLLMHKIITENSTTDLNTVYRHV